jgi:rRNA maturation protein Rpf1
MRKTTVNPVTYSADGRRILVTTEFRGRPQNIRVINVNGSAQQTLVMNAGTTSVSAGWNG